jgi:tRNA threonylcarbamoyl adenosine modification protein YeaZ
MHLLAIDASSDACSVGVAVDRAAPVLRSALVGRAHAEQLMPMIAEAMAAAGLAFGDLQRIAATVGPGSFTGVRIAVAAARGLALATGAQAIGIGTLAVHARAARPHAQGAPVVVAIAAGRGEIYAQRFAGDGRAEGDPRLGPLEAFRPLLDEHAVLAGSAADVLAAAAGAKNRIVHRDASPDVAALVGFALAAPDAKQPPRPLYLRPPDAKPQASAAVARR